MHHDKSAATQVASLKACFLALCVEWSDQMVFSTPIIFMMIPMMYFRVLLLLR